MTSAEYDRDKAIRTAAVSNKYNITTFVYRANGNYSNIKVSLTGHPISSKYTQRKGEAEVDDTITILFNITAYPSMNTTVNVTDLNEANDATEGPDSPDESESKPADDDFYKIISFPEDMKRPKIKSRPVEQVQNVVEILPSFDESILPEDIQEKLNILQTKLQNDIITKSGYNKNRLKLLAPFANIINKSSKSDQVKSDEEVTTDLRVEQRDVVTKDAKIKNAKEPKIKDDLSVAGHQHKKGDPGELKNGGNNHKRPEKQR